MSRARRLPKSVNQSPPCLSNTRSFGPFSGGSPHLSNRVSTLPVARSTRWIDPPIYSWGSGAAGIMVPRDAIQPKPPLLQIYILPSGPIAAPLGPPGISATTCLRPSGHTRVSRRPRISTSTTDPSGITTGPSGNSRSVARTRTFGMESSGLFERGRIQVHSAGATLCVAQSYGKVDLACQAIGDARLRKAAPRCRLSVYWTRFLDANRYPTSLENALVPDGYPDFETAIAGKRIELVVIPLE